MQKVKNSKNNTKKVKVKTSLPTARVEITS